MKNYLQILIISLFIWLFQSCERDSPVNLGELDCLYCYQDKPEVGPLDVLLTINRENPAVSIVVYIGNIEDKDTLYADTAYSTSYYVDVPVDAYYAVSAQYKSGDKIIFAVDGDEFKLKYTSDKCDVPCYYFSGGYYDVRLKD